jgi:hypothetical protein
MDRVVRGDSDLQCLRHRLFDVVQVGVTLLTSNGQLMGKVLVKVWTGVHKTGQVGGGAER